MFNPKGKLYRTTDKLLKSIREDDYNIKTKVEFQNKKRTYVKYINMPCAFDIEVSSFIKDDIKGSCMYIWQISLNGSLYYGRTWEQFKALIDKIKAKFNLSYNRRLVLYVHNLQYEFQFIRDMFTWCDLFARSTREPMYARTEDGIEFRCSYVLSGTSLEQTAKDLNKYKCKKLVGNLDYDLLRTPLTPLTKKEIDYSLQDVVCVTNYIKEEMENYGDDITKIPMTKTGKVRLKCREKFFNEENKRTYRGIIQSLRLNDKEEYATLKRAFQGGFTHASSTKANYVLENVMSKDFTSSYPTVMIAEQYPMSTGEKIKIHDLDEFKELSKTHCLIFNIHISKLTEKFVWEHYLSASKCWRYNANNEAVSINDKTANCKLDNGRIIEAEDIYTTITSIDLPDILKAYNVEGLDFGYGYKYRKGYLPKQFVDIILEFYEKKTTLKDVAGMEVEYQSAKSDVNSLYGMTVTDIINDTVVFDGEWSTVACDNVDEAIKKYNSNFKRFLFYPWGVFVTAYARHNLWTGIFELGEDYIYSDTDSVKYLNPEKHERYFEFYNKQITFKLQYACTKHGFDPNRACPKTIKGKSKPLGVWDDEAVDTPEGHIYAKTFKTLGAKRYMGEYYNTDSSKWVVKCTIAGVNKKKTAKWLSLQKDPYETFTNLMTVPKEYSGRIIVTYIDNPTEFDIEDFNGVPYHVDAHTGIHMAKSSYNLTLSDAYLQLLNGYVQAMI